MITQDDVNKRFDVIARAAFPFLQLSQVFQSIRKGVIRLNQQKKKGNVRLNLHDTISYHGLIPTDLEETIPTSLASQYTQDTKAEKLGDSLQIEYQQLEILLESNDIVIINKPRHWISHGEPPALTSWLHWQYGASESISFNKAPVHRLDVGTSGANILAKTITGARIASDLIQNHSIKKLYLTIMQGELKEPIHSEVYLERMNKKTFVYSHPGDKRKQAITTIYPLRHNAQFTLAACIIKTGRTHQIRAVTAHYHHPLLGDMLYNDATIHITGLKHQYYLHCYLLSDTSSTLFKTLHAPLPPVFTQAIKQLKLFIDPASLLDICTQLL